MFESSSMFSYMLLMNNMNERGPKIDPYSTPDSTETKSKLQLSNTMMKVELVRYELNAVNCQLPLTS